MEKTSKTDPRRAGAARPAAGHRAPARALHIAVDPDASPSVTGGFAASRPLASDLRAPQGALRIAVDPDASPSGTGGFAASRPLASDLRAPQGALRIAVDFDGVLFDHIPYVLRGFRDAHGIDLEDEGLRYWDFFQYRAVREKNLSWQSVREVLAAIDTDPALHDVDPRDPLAAEVMGRWMREGHRVSVVTAREEESRPTTEAFLKRNRIPHHDLVMEARIKTGYDVLVDDAPHNVLMAAADGGLALLMDHPYNRDVPTRRNPLRVMDWADVGAVVDASVVMA